MILPTQPTAGAKLALLVILLVIAGAIGAAVNGWRLDLEHERAMSIKQKEVDDLAGKLAEQTRGVEALQAKTEEADARRLQAEQFAASAIARSGTRAAKVAASAATSCDGVLREAWEGW